MDQIRKDYFSYYGEPRYEDGIQVLDMLVFRYQLAAIERYGFPWLQYKGVLWL